MLARSEKTQIPFGNDKQKDGVRTESESPWSFVVTIRCQLDGHLDRSAEMTNRAQRHATTEMVRPMKLLAD